MKRPACSVLPFAHGRADRGGACGAAVTTPGAGQALVEPLPAAAATPGRGEVDPDDLWRAGLLAELQGGRRRMRDRRLWALTSRPEPVRDVIGALNKLNGAIMLPGVAA